jgi:bifunctional non-homologous end joining protein LigD
MRGEKDKPQWLLMKRDDEAARVGEESIVRERPESVKRAPRRAKRARRSELPQFVSPQLATLVSGPPRSGDWLYEVKHDGYRMLARLGDGEAQLFTRTGRDWSAKLPRLVRALEALALQDSWLDGEIVVPGPEGRSSFQALQNAFEEGKDASIVYYVFDAPFLEGQDLRALPLRERKRRLSRFVSSKGQGNLRLSEHLAGTADDIFVEACRLGLEGLIGKEAGAPYLSGRTKSWIKLKCRQRQDFVIGGYTAPGGSRSGFGALLVGVHDASGKLHYAGKVGTGFDERRLASLSRRMNLLQVGRSPFVDPPKEKKVTWLKPRLVAEVAYAERTAEGLLRQASFMGLREDLPAKSVGEEKPLDNAASPASPALKITHPERLVWPSLGITKLDLVRYYEGVGEWFLPHVKGRPLTLVRCPDGAEAKCFYQRHLLMGASPGDLRTFKRERSSKAAYIYIDTLEAAISAVQNGAVEFHTWGATVPQTKRPDRITMDLDPGPGLAWKALAEGARLTRALLEGLGLRSFLKTTGGKGLHVVAPLRPELEWDEVKDFTRRLAAMLVRARPELFIDKMAKERRAGRIFVDYLRNAETASAVAAFSARARPGAYVSTPLAWEELGAADLRTKFSLKTLPRRLARLGADPWEAYPDTRQAITAKMKRALGVS